MNKLLIPLIALLAFSPLLTYAQALTQVVYGQVIFSSTGTPIQSAKVYLAGNPKVGALTDKAGRYRLPQVPVGRAVIVCVFAEDTIRSSAENITSGKEVKIDLSFDQVGVVIAGSPDGVPALEPANAATVVSGHTFSAEQVFLEPGNANDPSRMVQSVPGVQAVRDDNADIIIRGNAPMGLLWRLEGIDIPNPNHFARKGNTGGGITMFSTQLLGKSDFSTGAFAPEYGNALSGVFDMHFRDGNSNQRETRIQAGLLGLDAAFEGPFNAKDEKDDSYLINYRYSTLGILNQLGYNLLNPRISNTFQDLSFHVSLPSEDYKNQVSIFGIGGLSDEFWVGVEDSLDWSTEYRTTRDFLTRMGTMGFTYQRLLDDEKGFIRTTTAIMGSRVIDNEDTLDIRNGLEGVLPEAPFQREQYDNSRISNHTFYQRGWTPNKNELILKTGLISNFIRYAVNHEAWMYTDPGEGTGNFQTLLNGSGSTFQFQPYAQLRYTTPRLSLTGGVHAVFLTLNQTGAIEPRLAAKYQIAANDFISAAYGLHSRVLPLGNYFTQIEDVNGQVTMPNMNLPLMKAHHLVVGYEHLFPEQSMRLRVEGYYQSLFDVPVHTADSSFYWHLNRRDGYLIQAAESEGTGQNLGIDISLQKALSDGYFFSITGSAFDSRYSTPRLSGETFNTRYNARVAATIMGGIEREVGKNGRLIVSTRFIYSGGLKYTPGDSARSAALGQPVFDPMLAFSASQGTYFRSDLRITYRWSRPKASYQLALDVQNLTNRLTNVREEQWDAGRNDFIFIYQSGLIPIISFIADF